MSSKTSSKSSSGILPPAPHGGAGSRLSRSRLAKLLDALRGEAGVGVLLMVATAAAIIAANTGTAAAYRALLETPFTISFGDGALSKPVILWINDGLMALFFLLIGLELKREVLEGHLSKPSAIALPVAGAIGGMAVPALIYWAFNQHDPVAMKGWAIPVATDIAFALGCLSLIRGLPVSLRIFLLTLAIVDDIGAVAIIALFYTSDLSGLALGSATVGLVFLVLLNRLRVAALAPYMIIGVIIWFFVLKSGVHATLAGILVAMMIPLRLPDPAKGSPLHRLEHALHPWTVYAILPLFAFFNAGVPLAGVSLSTLLGPIPLGIVVALFVGNQAGILSLCWVAVKMKLARLPEGVTWRHLHGVAAFCGIGFTMSLFISSLAFEKGASVETLMVDRIGILAGSLLSGITGFLLLSSVANKRDEDRAPLPPASSREH